MGHSIYQVHTWECSIPDCGKKLTASGDDECGHLYAIENGWGQYVIASFGQAGDRPNFLDKLELYLCPYHNQQLREFLL
jgi:hypothetical protein